MAVKRRSDSAKKHVFKSWRDLSPMNASVGTMLHNLTGSWRYIKPVYEDKIPACQNACPAGNDIEAWTKLLQQGHYERAYWHLKREQPFPAVLGRICFRFCEGACNRAALDERVGINELERFVGDQAPASAVHPDLPGDNGKSLAVVGSGPAGMSAAYYGRLLGFNVTMFESLPEMGGLLRVGIPSYRLPREIVAAEFEGLKNMGVDLRPGTSVGGDIPFDTLHRDFDYIFLATGMHDSTKLDQLDAGDCPGIMSGLALLKKLALGETVDPGRRVVVVGGGNTAIDAARTSLRLGAEVTVLYRRSENEMPAHPREVQEAREEGIEFRFLAAPERIDLDDNGALQQLVCSEMELGSCDESGRPRPVKKEGVCFYLGADTILTAIGESPDLNYLNGAVRVDRGRVAVNDGLMVDTVMTGGAKIFAGGDIIAGLQTVVHAVAAGKRAAVSMDCDRRGVGLNGVLEKITVGDGPAISFSRYMDWQHVNDVPLNIKKVVDSETIVFDYFDRAPAVEKEVRPADSRKISFDPYRFTFTEEEAQFEAARCMHCGRCIECDNCLIFCPEISVLVKGPDRFGYDIDYDYCKGCGICAVECPRGAVTMIDEQMPIEEA